MAGFKPAQRRCTFRSQQPWPASRNCGNELSHPGVLRFQIDSKAMPAQSVAADRSDRSNDDSRACLNEVASQVDLLCDLKDVVHLRGAREERHVHGTVHKPADQLRHLARPPALERDDSEAVKPPFTCGRHTGSMSSVGACVNRHRWNGRSAHVQGAAWPRSTSARSRLDGSKSGRPEVALHPKIAPHSK